MSDALLPLLPEMSAEQCSQLDGFLSLLLEANARFNLTAIVEPSVARDRHIVESLRLVPLLDSAFGPSGAKEAPARRASRKRALDLGSGGGLPGMVLAIARPDVEFVLLEATAKKAHFLEETAGKLGLNNVVVECNRAELAAAQGGGLRERFDVVSARAVAALPTLLELAVPFLKVGGTLIAIKGERAEEELKASTQALITLYTECVGRERHPTSTVLLLRKNKSTPSHFPRRSGEPKKKPL